MHRLCLSTNLTVQPSLTEAEEYLHRFIHLRTDNSGDDMINISDILDGKIKEKNFEEALSLDAIELHGNVVELKDKSMVSLKVSNNGQGRANVGFEFNCTITLPCDRCLQPVSNDINVSGEVSVRTGDCKIVDGTEDEDSDFLEGYSINVDELILSEISMAIPVKVLCKEDCKGICSICGSNLNEGECGCDRFVPNAAFAGLSELFK